MVTTPLCMCSKLNSNAQQQDIYSCWELQWDFLTYHTLAPKLMMSAICEEPSSLYLFCAMAYQDQSF